ncbi:MAG: diacylglyceryl transferase [Sphingobacteriaceae bacterium]|nr:MAG: diacylglyceryl transferase [Sphingobacteriaceae bacterium]
MFATLSDIMEYLFGINIPLPIQTLGFFVALAFVLSFIVFVSEFKRKEKLGAIHPFLQKVTVGASASWIELLVNAFIGFIIGYKVAYLLLNYQAFSQSPVNELFSVKGNIWAGLTGAAAFALWIYYDRKKQQLPQPIVTNVLVHPYQLMYKIVFWVAVWGILGAKLFYCAENVTALLADPLKVLFSSNGFTYYGGLTFGALSYLYIGYNAGMKLSHLADIGSPGMMLAYAVGRFGCHLSGDGDWGIVNINPKPGWLSWLPDWAWSFNFPYNVIDMGRYIKGCTGIHCYELIYPVYPTSLYEAVACVALFGVMWILRGIIKIPGLMFCLYLLLNGTERILIEQIRVNYKYQFAGLAITQAEIICCLMLIGGIAGIVYILIQKHKKNKTNTEGI